MVHIILVRPVDKPDNRPIFVSMDRIVSCPKELSDVSWLGPSSRKRKTPSKKKLTAQGEKDQYLTTTHFVPEPETM